MIGRAAEVGRVRQILTSGEARLLTLCGVGGIGKTRLALEVARAAQAEFADGARLVELAPVREPGLVVSAIAAAILGSQRGPRPALEALKRALEQQHLLLVLDNFEHVLAAAPVVSALLAACPRLSILATSRAPLRLSWEHEFTLGPLAVPAAQVDQPPEALLACPSVALLRERMAGVDVSADDLSVLVGICRRLDGIPLALELAAARARLLPPAALLARLERPLELLTGGPRDAPARHQALRTTFDWSYQLLEAADQRLFRSLGVFVGGCTFEAAARVCDVPADDLGFLDALGRLVDSGLVSRVDHEPRLVLLEPVRDYALEQLRACGEHDLVRQRHALTYLELAEQGGPALERQQRAEWLVRLEPEHANCLVALRWFIDQRDAERGLRLAAALVMFWWARGFTRDGFDRLQQVLALPAPEPAKPPLALARADALVGAGTLAFWQGDFQTAEACLQAALAVYATASRPHAQAFALQTLGDCALALGELERADRLHAQSLAVYRAAADQRGCGHALVNLGRVAFYRGNYDHAHALLTQGLAAVQAVGDTRNAAQALRCLALVECHRGRFDAAQACVRQSLALWRDAPDRGSLAYLVEAAALVAIATGRTTRGLKVAAAAAALREELDTPGTPAWMHELECWLDRARVAAGREVSAKAWADGLALGVEAAIAEALAPDSRPAAPAPASGLTRRETEVLRLLARGQTNKEIATQLLLSVATVERHVANIYAKLGARGRAEATALAITRGLLPATP